MKRLSQLVLGTSIVFALCSCASRGEFHSSAEFNGMTAPSMDLASPRFYMREGEMAPILSRPDLFRPADAR